MRIGLSILFLLAAGASMARAQDRIIEKFDGTTAQTTAPFTVADKWELRWTGATALTITALNADGTIAFGTAATADGSLYQSKGGTFYLQLAGAPASTSLAWQVRVVELGDASPSASSRAVYVPPAVRPVPAGSGLLSASASALTNLVVNPLAPLPAKINEAQTRAIVLLKGDESEGTGFLTHDKDGTPVVITNNHVLFDNPNVKITTTDGRVIPVLAYRGATDRDLVMMTIKDDHYSYLDLATDVDHLVKEGDDVLTPGNSEGGEVFLDTSGEIKAIGPNKVEISNPIFHGNSGGPVLHVASGRVVGAVYMSSLVHPHDLFDAASLANPASALGKTRYFAVRIDTVPAWESYDWNRFLTETTFLHNFHKQSRLLDSLINGARYEKAGLPVTSGDEGYFPNAHLFVSDERLRTLAETYHQESGDADKSQQMDAMRELFSGLVDYAATDAADIARPQNFYQFDRIRATAEIAYRKHLTDQLNNVGDRISDLGH